MIYQIYYKDRDKTLFDIEFYLTENSSKEWYLELNSGSFISGAIEFIQENLTSKERIDKFKKDCEEIEELRGWLWEQHDNKPKTMDEAEEQKTILGKELKEKIYKFAKFWDLSVNED